MRRFSAGLTGTRPRAALAPGAALVAAGLLAVAAAPAGATITPTRDALTATNAAVVAGFPLDPQGPAFFLAIPPNGNPVAVADAASGLAGFPRNGTTFLILSTGDATRADHADQPGTFPSVDDGQGQPIRGKGDSAFDVSELQIVFDAIGNVTTGCLGFDVRFLSEEYPSKIGAAFNDAFVAEGDNGVAVLGALWGNGKGKFRTSGKYSSATVRGTIWLTQDRCDGTLTKVKRGIVSVRDFKRRRTVSVKAGHSYLARAAGRARGAK